MRCQSYLRSVKLPNNRTQAWHRLMQMKSRMQRQTKYRADFTKFMQCIIDNRYAELVPRDQLDSTDVWYVQHHGVYHAMKIDKLRVVFDCSARTNGVALNDLLLQEPDLTNALTGVLTLSLQNTTQQEQRGSFRFEWMYYFVS